MEKGITFLPRSLASQLTLILGVILLVAVGIQGGFSIHYQADQHLKNAFWGADRMVTTIRLGTHYAMMLNSREDINQIIHNVGQHPDILHLRIYSKTGEIKYSKDPKEINRTADTRPEGCAGCHLTDPPRERVSLKERIRLIKDVDGFRKLALTSPIYNEPSCATAECHFHPEEKKVLGILDISVSLEQFDTELIQIKQVTAGSTIFVFLLSAVILYGVITRLIKHPIDRLVRGTRRISEGKYGGSVEIDGRNEFWRLAQAINDMGREIGRKQTELNRQRDEYQNLFELVPCLITIQDRDYRLSGYNRKFAELFDPKPGDFCYSAYKGRTEKCANCPVEKTFQDGRSHFSEESGPSRDGSESHWIVTTSPIRDDAGEVVAAMEISIDVTEMKQLQKMLLATEKKYHTIFNNIPNPVFVLEKRSLDIVDCNAAAQDLYGLSRQNLTGKSFLDLFYPDERDHWEAELRRCSVIYQVKHRGREGLNLFVSIRISPLEYPGQDVFLVTTNDITKRIEAEQQLVQAGKMATLGEMATGVAHELNQPLSVIKTASSYFMRKVSRAEPIESEILFTMSREIDSHVDRATKIISHMREFGRKSNLSPEVFQVNDVIRRAFDIFSQQLKLRGIKTVWELSEGLPPIKADMVRLEQVFINLLINARDAIEDRWEHETPAGDTKRITLRTGFSEGCVVAEVEDTGSGIPTSLADKIFEPFFTTKKVGKGTGLGLSISYGIIQDFGGSIHVKPVAGPGAVLEIKLPIPNGET